MHQRSWILASLLAMAISVSSLYVEEFGRYSVVIATSPAEAEIKVNGKDSAKAPLTLQLKCGTYTVEASRPGYEPGQYAIFVSAREPNLVNIQLVPVPNPQRIPSTVAATCSALTQNNGSQLHAEIEKLKAALILNPEEALSLPVIREKLRVQEELWKALRDDLKEVKEQNKWYIRSMNAIVVSLLAIIATLLAG